MTHVLCASSATPSRMGRSLVWMTLGFSLLFLAACAAKKPPEQPSQQDQATQQSPTAQQVQTTPQDRTTPSPQSADGGNASQTQRIAQEKPAQMDPLDDPNGTLAKRSIYFDYNRYDIRADQRQRLEAHAHYLATHPDRKVRLEGNADERGSREYNLALGQKRAEAIKRAMKALRAKDGQAEATSNGKEKPKAQGHDEESWAENRRVDILYH